MPKIFAATPVILGLAFGLAFTGGAYVSTANRPRIRPEDFRGLKMRIQGSKVQDATARQLGAIPQILAFSEVYQSLQTGVVDGEDNVPSNILTQRFFEVQKYLTVS